MTLSKLPVGGSGCSILVPGQRPVGVGHVVLLLGFLLPAGSLPDLPDRGLVLAYPVVSPHLEWHVLVFGRPCCYAWGPSVDWAKPL
jgi:hypothetical protein